MARKHLEGLRVAALAADGFEQVELTVPLKALRRAGALVEVVSLHSGSIRGMNLLIPGKKVDVDRVLGDADPAGYDALLLPGGFISPHLLRQSEEALAFVRAFDRTGKPIAVICHGPWVLASAGLLSPILAVFHSSRRDCGRQCAGSRGWAASRVERAMANPL